MVSLGSPARPIRVRTQVRAVSGWFWPQVLSTLADLAGFGLVALVLHEFFHYVTLQALGGSGYITFDWEMGRTHFTGLPNHLWAVRLSGGLLTGAFLLLFFWFRPRCNRGSRSAQNLSRELAAFAWALGLGPRSICSRRDAWLLAGHGGTGLWDRLRRRRSRVPEEAD